MKKNYFWNLFAIMMVTMLSFGFTSCDNDDVNEPDAVTIVGTWVCDFDKNTDLIVCFKKDGTGYLYFTEDGLDDEDYFSYNVRNDEITLYYQDDGDYYQKTIEYNLSDDGKRLTLYGFDDNDMAVLHFKKQ